MCSLSVKGHQRSVGECFIWVNSFMFSVQTADYQWVHNVHSVSQWQWVENAWQTRRRAISKLSNVYFPLLAAHITRLETLPGGSQMIHLHRTNTHTCMYIFIICLAWTSDFQFLFISSFASCFLPSFFLWAVKHCIGCVVCKELYK